MCFQPNFMPLFKPCFCRHNSKPSGQPAKSGTRQTNWINGEILLEPNTREDRPAGLVRIRPFLPKPASRSYVAWIGQIGWSACCSIESCTPLNRGESRLSWYVYGAPSKRNVRLLDRCCAWPLRLRPVLRAMSLSWMCLSVYM